jgi:hypothetical protein
MTKKILVAVPLAALALAAPAAADGGKQKYRAALTGAGVQGKAKLEDGKRRDKVAVRLRGLTAGATYGWELRRSAAGADACAGEAVAGFTYRALKVRHRGNASARGTASGFAAEEGAVYAVVVTGPDGAPVACGELQSKVRRRETKAERRGARGVDRLAGDSAGDVDDSDADATSDSDDVSDDDAAGESDSDSAGD